MRWPWWTTWLGRLVSCAPVAIVLWPQTRGVNGSGVNGSRVSGSGGSRPAAGVAVPTVAVPRGVDRVTLELQLDAPDFVRYSATLKESATGRNVWHGDRLVAAAPAPGKLPAV